MSRVNMSVLGDVDCDMLNRSDIKSKFCVVGSRIAFLKSTTTLHPSSTKVYRLPSSKRPRDESGLPFDKTDSMTRLHSNRPTTSSFSILVLLPQFRKADKAWNSRLKITGWKSFTSFSSFTNRREEDEHKCKDFGACMYVLLHIVVRPTSNL